jgi:hypothetical protein
MSSSLGRPKFPGVDGRGDDHLHRPRPDIQGAPGLDGQGAVDAHRHNGFAGLHGHEKHPFFKGQQLPGSGPGAFGKDDDGTTLLDQLGGVVEAPDGLLEVAAVNRDIPQAAHDLAEQGDVKKGPFGHPAEIAGHQGLEDENVELAPVVGGIDIGLAGDQALHTLHADGNGKNFEQQHSPETGAFAPQAPLGLKHRKNNDQSPDD